MVSSAVVISKLLTFQLLLFLSAKSCTTRVRHYYQIMAADNIFPDFALLFLPSFISNCSYPNAYGHRILAIQVAMNAVFIITELSQALL